MTPPKLREREGDAPAAVEVEAGVVAPAVGRRFDGGGGRASPPISSAASTAASIAFSIAASMAADAAV